MTCMICQLAETQTGTATVTLEREGATLVVKGVPAHVCPNCGEEYVDSEVSGRVFQMAERAVRDNVTLEMLEYDDGRGLKTTTS